MKYLFKKGDRFKINHKLVYKIYPNVGKCKYPNLVFSVYSLSKSSQSVYYIDNRSNIKCSCRFCTSISSIDSDKNIIKSISISSIVLVETKEQRQRNYKLSQIFDQKKKK